MPSLQQATVTSHGAPPRLGPANEKKGLPDLRTAVQPELDILDIRHAAVEINLKAEISSLFHARDGPRKLPTLLLYDERGLQLFEKASHPLPRHSTPWSPTLTLSQITYLEEYYLTNDEIEVLRSFSADIVKGIPSGAMVIELGSGSVTPWDNKISGDERLTVCASSNLRKVNLLLQALEDAGKSIDYYALDLSQQELERTLAQLPSYQHVRAHGLLGTYDDGQQWLKDAANASRQKCILSLGSSVGELGRS